MKKRNPKNLPGDLYIFKHQILKNILTKSPPPKKKFFNIYENYTLFMDSYIWKLYFVHGLLLKFKRSYQYFEIILKKYLGKSFIGWVYHIPDIYFYNDNFHQLISDHIYMFFCFVFSERFDIFNKSDFYYLKVINIGM